MEEMIEIRKVDYYNLLRDQKILEALQAYGVDEWEYYDEALEYVEAEAND